MPESAGPKFRKPPVIETVMGVEFAPLAAWSIPHFGLFWNRVRPRLPKFEVHPPIASQVESFDSLPQQSMRIELATHAEARCWFLNDSGSELLQVQGDRFILNWRRRPSDVEYPGYDEFVRPQFGEYWTAFRKFLDEEGIEAPRILQCELAYVSHIAKGDGWTKVEDWQNVFNTVAPLKEAVLLTEPESAAFSLSYILPDKRGRLRVEAKHAVIKSDAKEIIALTVTARGRPANSELAAVFNWFTLGHQWVVQGFADFTTTAMHESWGRYQ